MVWRRSNGTGGREEQVRDVGRVLVHPGQVEAKFLCQDEHVERETSQDRDLSV